MIFENFGVEKHYDSHLASTSYLLRFLKYNAPDTANGGDNAIPRHTDKTFLSILHQNNVNGLEIKTKEGEWIGFNLTPSSFVVMAGDASMVNHQEPQPPLTYSLSSFLSLYDRISKNTIYLSFYCTICRFENSNFELCMFDLTIT